MRFEYAAIASASRIVNGVILVAPDDGDFKIVQVGEFDLATWAAAEGGGATLAGEEVVAGLAVGRVDDVGTVVHEVTDDDCDLEGWGGVEKKMEKEGEGDYWVHDQESLCDRVVPRQMQLMDAFYLVLAWS